jgi:hypothetical protein
MNENENEECKIIPLWPEIEIEDREIIENETINKQTTNEDT